MANYTATGTQDYPISLNDSDEGLYHNDDDDNGPFDSPYQLSENWDHDKDDDDIQDSFQLPPFSAPLLAPSWHHPFDGRQSTDQGKKRKRGNSMASNSGYDGSSRGSDRNPPFLNGYSDLQAGSSSMKPSLENRITNPLPESKKSRKRRRKLQRQVEEDVRIKEAGLDLLNNPNAMPMGLPQNPTLLAKAGPNPSLNHHPKGQRVTRSMARSTLPQPPASVPSIPKPLKGFAFGQGSQMMISGDTFFTRDFREPLPSQHDIFRKDAAGSKPPRPPISTNVERPAKFTRSEAPSPASATGSTPSIPHTTLPYSSLPPPSTSLPNAPIPANPHRESAKSKPVSKGPSLLMAQQQSAPPPPTAPPPPLPPVQTATHSLPPKPPPPLPAPIIGMTHDHDPDFRHSTFRIPPTVKAAGPGNKTPYAPKVKRTLVLTSLPKTSRTQEWVTSWAKKASQIAPLRVVIDTQNAKALVEFTNENVAEKAWGSARLGLEIYGGAPGGGVTGPKKFMKGKPREDLIRAWWYRLEPTVNKAKVPQGPAQAQNQTQTQTQNVQPKMKQKQVEDDLEIEEGEIVEGDEVEEPPSPVIAAGQADEEQKKETKKEKKRRLAKERMEKKGQKDAQKGTSVPNHAPTMAHSNSSMSVDSMSWYGSYNSAPVMGYDEYKPWESFPMQSYPSFAGGSSTVPAPPVTNPAPTFSDKGANAKPKTVVASTDGQADDLDDYEEVDMDLDMEVDDYDLGDEELKYPDFENYPPPEMRMSVDHPTPMSHPPPPAIAPPPLPPPPPSHPPQLVSKPIPTEPRAQKAHMYHLSASSAMSVAPPTEPRSHSQQSSKPPPAGPSFAKRALLARQKELENQIEKSRRELAVLSAVTGVSPQVSSAPVRPAPIPVADVLSMDSQGAEERLRKLVLASQRSKAVAAAAAAAASSAPSTPVPSMHAHAPATGPAANPTANRPTEPKSVLDPGTPSFLPRGLLGDQTKSANVASANFSLEDLAVSFITQTIETIKAKPDEHVHVRKPSHGSNGQADQSAMSTPVAMKPLSAAAKPAPLKADKTTNGAASTSTTNSATPEKGIPSGPVTLQVKLELKQRILLQHIQQTKQLIDRLGEATSKEEKDKLTRAMKLKDKIYTMEIAAIEKLSIVPESSNSGASTPSVQQSSSNRSSHQTGGNGLSTYGSNSSLSSKPSTGWSGQFVGLQAQTLVVDLSDDEDSDEEEEEDGEV